LPCQQEAHQVLLVCTTALQIHSPRPATPRTLSSRSTTDSLTGASHALLASLGSCAHRIVLDAISYLLRGLRESLSLDLFLAVVVRVLCCPALEVVILPEQQLEGLADDVGRICVDEFGILVQISSDFFLQADLKVCSLRSLLRCFQ
jgi:hypothetical protein